MKKLNSFFIILASIVLLSIGCDKGTAADDEGNTDNSFTDSRDGQIYKTVVIGNQTWFAENLNYEEPISFWYGNNNENGATYGRLYGYTLAKNTCPTGWHLPSDNEWKELEMFLGMSLSEADRMQSRGTDEGSKLKSTSGWSDAGNGSNSSGFTALPGGIRNNNGGFESLLSVGLWWTSTQTGAFEAIARSVYYSSDKIMRYNQSMSFSYSVRCVKD